MEIQTSWPIRSTLIAGSFNAVLAYKRSQTRGLPGRSLFAPSLMIQISDPVRTGLATCAAYLTVCRTMASATDTDRPYGKQKRDQEQCCPG